MKKDIPQSKILLSIFAAAAIAVAIYWFEAPHSGDDGPTVGTPAPDLRWTDVSGQSATIAAYRGRVVLVDFWATWCTTCQDEQPNLERLYSKYHPQGLELLAPSLDETGRQALVPYLTSHPVPWKVLLSDSQDAQLFHVFGLPTKVLIDRRGVIAKKYVGPVDPRVLDQDVRQLLDQEAS